MPTLHIVRVQLDPADLEALVKYVQFSDIVPSPQLFSKTQQTPKLEAQDPEEDPLKYIMFISSLYQFCIDFTPWQRILTECSRFHFDHFKNISKGRLQ